MKKDKLSQFQIGQFILWRNQRTKQVTQVKVVGYHYPLNRLIVESNNKQITVSPNRIIK